MKPRDKPYYINNKEFLQHLVQRKDVNLTKKEQYLNERYIAESIMKICRRYSTKYNFAGYTYRDEMVQEAIIACVKAINNYNTEYENPLAYFTTVATNAFINYINKEKKQSYIRRQMLTNMNTHTFLDEEEYAIVENAVNILTQNASSENLSYYENRETERQQKKLDKLEEKINNSSIEEYI